MARKEATEEQKAAAKAKRERLNGICKKVSAMTEQEKEAFLLENQLVTSVTGNTLSLVNTCLIIDQTNGEYVPTIVGGFKQWKANGRIVKKGEKSLAIWVPCKRKDTDEKSGEVNESTYFTFGNVFDISQTQEITDEEE